MNDNRIKPWSIYFPIALLSSCAFAAVFDGWAFFINYLIYCIVLSAAVDQVVGAINRSRDRL